MQSAKDAASNVAASAKSGMDKTKAIVEEKAEKMTTRDPVKKEMAEQKKEARINEAERMKHETRAQNAAARREHGHGLGYNATGTDTAGYSTGMTDSPAGYTATEGAVGSQHPAGTTTTGTGRTGLQDPRVAGGRSSTGYGSGGAT